MKGLEREVKFYRGNYKYPNEIRKDTFFLDTRPPMAMMATNSKKTEQKLLQ